MSNELAKLKVTLEAQTSAYKKEMKEAREVTKQVSDSIKSETSKITANANMEKATESVRKQMSIMRKLMQGMRLERNIPIEANTEGNNETKELQRIKELKDLIGKAKTELSEYQTLLGKWNELEVPESESLAYKKLRENIEQTKLKLREYQEEENKIKSNLGMSQRNTEDNRTQNGRIRQYIRDAQTTAGIRTRTDEFEENEKDIERATQAIERLEQKKRDLLTNGENIDDILGINAQLEEAEKRLEAFEKKRETLRNSGRDTERAYTGRLSDGNSFQTAGAVMRQTASRIREMKEAAAEALKRIPVLGRALSNAAAIGSKGWGGLKKLISGVGSGLKTLASGAIRKASGAFSALIQKFSSGIPLMKRFSSANKSVSSGLGGGLKNILKYTLGIRSLFVLVNKLRSALVDGFKNLSQYSGETNNSLSMLMSSLTQLKNAFAAAFAPILNVVAPILNSIIQKIISVVNTFGQLTSALTGKTTYIKAKKVQQDYAKSLNSNAASATNAKKANEELQRTILSFDQINKMDDNSSSDSDNGIADTGGLSPSDMFDTQSIPSRIKGIADMIKQAWKNADFTDIGTMVGNKLNAALNSIPWDKIRNTCNKIAKSIATFLKGFIEAVDWKLVGNTFAQGINTVFDAANTFAENFHWKSLGDAIGNGVNGALGGLDWNLIQETVHNIATGITDTLNSFIQTTDWALVGQSFGNGINTILDFFYTGINNFDWTGTGAALAEFVNNAINTIDFVKLGQTVSDGVKGIFDFGIAAIEGVDWSTVGEKVWDGLAAIDWNGISDKFFELLGAAFGGLSAFLGGFISDAVAGAQKYFQKKIEECGGNISLGILKGIKDGIVGIGEWIVDHVFTPFIDGFKKAFGIHSPSTVMAEQGGFVISGLLKGVEDKAGNFFGYIKDIPGKTVNFIGDIKGKVHSKGTDIIQGLKEGFTDRWDSFTDILSELPNKIQDAVPNLFDVGAGIIQNFANGFSSIHIPMPHIGWDWSGGNINIGNWSFSLPRFNLQWYAQGGFPEAGQLFMANEAGPELVGKMGNRNAVANNNQIVEGIKAGVFEAVLDALNASGILDRDDSEKEVVLELTVKTDSETLYKAVRKGKRKYDHRYAVTELI